MAGRGEQVEQLAGPLADVVEVIEANGTLVVRIPRDGGPPQPTVAQR